jgi:hypothetical protein
MPLSYAALSARERRIPRSGEAHIDDASPLLYRPVDALEDVERGAFGGRRGGGEGVHSEQPRGRRSPEQPLVRGNRACHAGAVRVRIFRRANRVEALRHRALEVRMRDVDFRIDHRDRHVGATDHAMNVRSGRSPDWLKMKNPSAAAVNREAEEDWGR